MYTFAFLARPREPWIHHPVDYFVYIKQIHAANAMMLSIRSAYNMYTFAFLACVWDSHQMHIEIDCFVYIRTSTANVMMLFIRSPYVYLCLPCTCKGAKIFFLYKSMYS